MKYKLEHCTRENFSGVFLSKNSQGPMYIPYDELSQVVDLLYAAIPRTPSRIDIIGQNGGTGLHYIDVDLGDSDGKTD